MHALPDLVGNILAEVDHSIESQWIVAKGHLVLSEKVPMPLPFFPDPQELMQYEPLVYGGFECIMRENDTG